jgi:hypothetical protein
MLKIDNFSIRHFFPYFREILNRSYNKNWKIDNFLMGYFFHIFGNRVKISEFSESVIGIPLILHNVHMVKNCFCFMNHLCIVLWLFREFRNSIQILVVSIWPVTVTRNNNKKTSGQTKIA